MKFYGIGQDFGYKEYITLEKAKESESNLLIVKDDYGPSTGHNFTFYNENNQFSNSFFNEGWKGFISNIEEIDQYKKKFTFTFWNSSNSINLLFDKLKSNKPFAFGHFNDGEINCIINIQNTPAGEKCDNYIKNKLLNSLEVAKKYPNDCIVGIPCSKCHYKEFKYIDNYIKKNNKILGVCIHHLKYEYDSVDKLFDIITKNFINIILVSNKKHNLTKFKTKYNIKNLKHIPVGDNFYEININTNELLHNLDNNTIVLFACGMGGRILAFEWFNINNKCTYLNIGSICDDVFLNIKLGYEDGKHKYCEECYPFKK